MAPKRHLAYTEIIEAFADCIFEPFRSILEGVHNYLDEQIS